MRGEVYVLSACVSVQFCFCCSPFLIPLSVQAKAKAIHLTFMPVPKCCVTIAAKHSCVKCTTFPFPYFQRAIDVFFGQSNKTILNDL